MACLFWSRRVCCGVVCPFCWLACGVGIVLRRRFSFWSFGGFVCPNCWLGFGVGIGLFGAGFGRSVCAVVSFRLLLWSAPSGRRPSPYSAKKCEVRVVSASRLNSAPSISGGGSGRGGPACYTSIWGRTGHPRSQSGAPEGGPRYYPAMQIIFLRNNILAVAKLRRQIRHIDIRRP